VISSLRDKRFIKGSKLEDRIEKLKGLRVAAQHKEDQAEDAKNAQKE